jgi:hypothetical protein
VKILKNSMAYRETASERKFLMKDLAEEGDTDF